MPTKEITMDDLCELWNTEVYPKIETLDPDDYFLWESLMYGWALAKGADIYVAAEFATYYLEEI